MVLLILLDNNISYFLLPCHYFLYVTRRSIPIILNKVTQFYKSEILCIRTDVTKHMVKNKQIVQKCYSLGVIKTNVSDRISAENTIVKSPRVRRLYRGCLSVLLWCQSIWSVLIQPTTFWFMYTNWVLFSHSLLITTSIDLDRQLREANEEI